MNARVTVMVSVAAALLWADGQAAPQYVVSDLVKPARPAFPHCNSRWRRPQARRNRQRWFDQWPGVASLRSRARFLPRASIRRRK